MLAMIMDQEIEVEVDPLENDHVQHGFTVEEAEHDDYFGGAAMEAVECEDDEAVVILNNIHKTYLLGVEGVSALRGVTLSVKRGEFICIYGTSGGGKTSLLNIIGTIDKPSKGELFINKTRITYNTSDKVLADIRLKDLGFVFQTFNLLSNLTAIENVMMPLVLDGALGAKERREKATNLLDRVGMKQRMDHFPSQLSGGEQQRVTIARALVNDPSLLLLDEPTGDLDTVNTAIVMKLLTEVNAQGVSLIMVTHDVGLKYFADRIIWLRDGKIQRVEHVGDDKKQETLRKLDEDLRKLNIKSDNERDVVKEAHNFQNTDVRRPSDYQTHRDYDPEKAKVLSSFSNAEQMSAK